MFKDSKTEQADKIQQRMKSIRKDMKDEVIHVKQSAHTLTDWHFYIRKYPWACMGIAAAVGYMVVPRKLNIQSLDAKAVEKLAKKNRIVVESNPKDQSRKTLAQGAFTFLTGLALRSATYQIASKFASMVDKGNAGPQADPGEEVSTAGVQMTRNVFPEAESD